MNKKINILFVASIYVYMWLKIGLWRGSDSDGMVLTLANKSVGFKKFYSKSSV